jgi:guanylate kinase
MATSQPVERKILVLVGPPGVGKKFCTLRFNGNHPMDVEIMKTLTTQPPRQVFDTLFYTTVDLEEFQQRLAGGHLLEHDEFAGHWYGIERASADAVLKQKHGVVSATPVGAETLRRSGIPTIIVYLIPATKTLIEDNLRQKHEHPERLRSFRAASAMFDRLPESAYDIALYVKSLEEAAKELDERLSAFMQLH